MDQSEPASSFARRDRPPIEVPASASEARATIVPKLQSLASSAPPSNDPSGKPQGAKTDAVDAEKLAELELRMQQGGVDGAAAVSELAAIVEKQGDRGRAGELFTDAVRRFEQEAGKGTAEHASSILRRAQFEERGGQLETALRSLDEALDLAPAGDGWPLRTDALYAKASVLRQLGRAPEALAQVELASAGSMSASSDPEQVDLHGALLIETGKLEEAVRHYEHARDGQDPADPTTASTRLRWTVGRAEALVDLGRYEEAVDPLETALAKVTGADPGLDAGELRPRIEFALAQALRGTGGDESRVETLAGSAREAWKGRTDQLSLDRLGRLEAFLGL
jgi:tetratricopeptide (TPR) repeat protein